jgi:hypothetical protein
MTTTTKKNEKKRAKEIAELADTLVDLVVRELSVRDMAAGLWDRVDAFCRHKRISPKNGRHPNLVVSIVRHQLAKLETAHGHNGGYDRVFNAVSSKFSDTDFDAVDRWDELKGVFVETHAKVEDELLLRLAADSSLPKYLAANDEWFAAKVRSERPADLSHLGSGRTLG